MRVRTMIYVLIAFFLFSTSAFAQIWPNADDIIAKVQKDLSLNYEQTKKVKVIIEENIAKRRATRPQLIEGLTQSQSEPLEKELYQKLSEVLTTSQMSQWNTVIAQMIKVSYPTVPISRDKS